MISSTPIMPMLALSVIPKSCCNHGPCGRRSFIHKKCFKPHLYAYLLSPFLLTSSFFSKINLRAKYRRDTFNSRLVIAQVFSA